MTSKRGRDDSEMADLDAGSAGGENEMAVRADLDGITAESPVANSLAAAAITLARQLDAGAGMATAAVVRELRATLEAMVKTSGDAADAEIDELSSPI